MMRIDRRVFRPVSAAARTSRSIVAVEAARTIDAALASGAVEAVARSVVERRVAERLTAEVLASAELAQNGDAADVVTRLMRSDQIAAATQAAVEEVLRAPAFRNEVAGLLASPEVRRGLADGASGFGDDVADAFRRRSASVDDTIETRVRETLRLSTPAVPSPYGGVAARGAALLVDLALAQAVVLVGVWSFRLVLSLLGLHVGGTLAAAAGGVGWTLTLAVYFAVFWSAIGQTPGMRLFGVRVQTRDGRLPSLPRALVRVVVLAVSTAAALLGFLPVLVDEHRRALHDFVAGTVVVRS